MQRLSPSILLMAFLAATILFQTGCSTSPPTRFYALSSFAAGKPTEAGMAQKEPVVVSVGPVGIPEYLDRQQIVTRNSTNQLTLGDFDFWGGSLENDVNRVMVDNLSVMLAPKGISAVTWRARVPFAYSISISMTRFEATGDAVILKSQWGIVEAGGQTAAIVRGSVITKPLAGRDYKDIVGGMSDALADLSREIAVSIEKTVEISRAERSR